MDNNQIPYEAQQPTQQPAQTQYDPQYEPQYAPQPQYQHYVAPPKPQRPVTGKTVALTAKLFAIASLFLVLVNPIANYSVLFYAFLQILPSVGGLLLAIFAMKKSALSFQMENNEELPDAQTGRILGLIGLIINASIIGIRFIVFCINIVFLLF